jgi:hypothetical protein
MSIPMVEMLQIEFQSLQKNFFKIVKIELANKVESFFFFFFFFFYNVMAFLPVKYHFSYLSLF